MIRSILLTATISAAILAPEGRGQDVFPLKPSEANSDSQPSAGGSVLTNTDTELESNEATPEVHQAEVVEPVYREYAIKRGDNLSKVSEEIYGNAGYWRLIKLYNPDIDPDKLQEGQIVRVPDLESFLTSEKLMETLGDTFDGLIKVRASMLEREDSLVALAEAHSGSEPIDVPEDMRTELQDGKKKVEAAMERLSETGEGVVAVPQSTVAQLRSVAELLGEVAAGKPDQFADKLNRAHQHLGLALTYSVIWAREGFK